MTRRRFPVGKTLLYVFMSLWALTTIYPFIWVILNSFKPRGLIRSDTFSLPIGDKFTLENYVTPSSALTSARPMSTALSSAVLSLWW